MPSTIHPSIKAECRSLLSKTNVNHILFFICLYLIFICIALLSLFENSMIAERENVYLCNSLISAALGWGKDIRKVSGFCESKDFSHCLSHLLTRRQLREYFIGDLEPFLLHPHLVDKVSCLWFLQLIVWTPIRLSPGVAGRDGGQSQQRMRRVGENHSVHDCHTLKSSDGSGHCFEVDSLLS